MTQSDLPPPPSLASLRSAAAVALFLDFDGTLVKIASGPDAIEVLPGLKDKLEALSDRLEGRLAIVTGRGLDNLQQHLGPMAVARAGSHGADKRAASGQVLGNVPKPLDDRTLVELTELADSENVLLERKAHGAAIHYRKQPDRAHTITAVVEGIAKRGDLAVKHGKCVIELVRPGTDKGGAVDAFMQTALFTGTIPIFVGDDVTDEDGFAATKRHGGFGIAVGERVSQSAKYAIANVDGVYRWLDL